MAASATPEGPGPRIPDDVPADDAPETVTVEQEVVACDGGGALGHPRVFLNMEGKGAIDCPYCDKRFVLKAGAGGGGH